MEIQGNSLRPDSLGPCRSSVACRGEGILYSLVSRDLLRVTPLPVRQGTDGHIHYLGSLHPWPTAVPMSFLYPSDHTSKDGTSKSLNTHRQMLLSLDLVKLSEISHT